jgi:hypothetical protein
VASSVRKLLEKKELAEALEGIDTSNIIEGGRRARRSTAPAPVPAPAVKKSKPEPSKPSKYTHQTLHSTVDFPRMSSQGVCVCGCLQEGCGQRFRGSRVLNRGWTVLKCTIATCGDAVMDLPFSLRARFGGKIDASIMTDVFISCDCDVASATVMLTAMVEDENTDEPSGAWSWQSWTAFVRGLEGVLRRLNLGGNVAQWAQSPHVWPGGEFSVASQPPHYVILSIGPLFIGLPMLFHPRVDGSMFPMSKFPTSRPEPCPSRGGIMFKEALDKVGGTIQRGSWGSSSTIVQTRVATRDSSSFPSLAEAPIDAAAVRRLQSKYVVAVSDASAHGHVYDCRYYLIDADEIAILCASNDDISTVVSTLKLLYPEDCATCEALPQTAPFAAIADAPALSKRDLEKVVQAVLQWMCAFGPFHQAALHCHRA